LFSPEADKKGLELKSHIAEDVPKVLRGDSVRLGEILTNLVSNALKFSDEGCILVSCAQVGTDNGIVTLQFDVTDQGIGIPERELAHVFDQFRQVDGSSKRKYGGTGLGLAICRELAQAMGGEINVASEYGSGSRFWFTVRLQLAEGAYGAKSAAAQTPLTLTPATGIGAVASRRPTRPPQSSGPRRRKVLVVDDNEVNLLVARRMLEALGLDVDFGNNGREAIERFSANKYDAVLIDNQMPEMTGNEATAAIRSKERDGQRTPIIALTASATVLDRDNAFAAGVDAFLSKPVLIEELEACIAEVLGIGLVDGDGDLAYPLFDAALDDVFEARIVNDLRSISTESGADLFTELAEKFLDYMPARLDTILSAAINRDLSAVRRQAHHLLGLCLQIGAVRVAESCKTIEDLPDDVDTDTLDGKVTLLLKEFSAAAHALDTYFRPASVARVSDGDTHRRTDIGD